MKFHGIGEKFNVLSCRVSACWKFKFLSSIIYVANHLFWSGSLPLPLLPKRHSYIRDKTKQNNMYTHTHTHYPAVCMYTGIICTHTFLTCCSDNKISCTNYCNYVPMNHLIHYYTPLTGQHSKHTHSHMYTYVNGTNCKLLTLKSQLVVLRWRKSGRR